MTYQQLQQKASDTGTTPLEAYLNMHPNCVKFKRGSNTYTFRHKETNDIYSEIIKISWDETGDVLFHENCLFFSGNYQEARAYFAAGTTNQADKLSKWVTSIIANMGRV